MCLRCLGMKHDWNDGTKKRWSRLFAYACNCGSFSRFRTLYFMNLILITKYTLSIEFVLAQVRGNNHWRTSQVRLKSLNYEISICKTFQQLVSSIDMPKILNITVCVKCIYSCQCCIYELL
jgi:hypothetical protein